MARPDRRKSYAVLIGVSAYHDPLWEAVPGAQNNIQALRDLLTGADGCIAPENCILVPNPSSPAEILKNVLDVGAKATDLFLLYYVGHGFPDEARHLYLTDSGTAHEPRLREASALEWERVRIAVRDEVDTQRKMVVIDSCHSGLAVGHLGSDRPLLDIEGTFVLASTVGTDTVPGGEPYTRFTGELIDLLQVGVADDSRYLTPWMIYEELRHRLRRSRLRIPAPLSTGNVSELLFMPNNRYTPTTELRLFDRMRRWWHTRQANRAVSSDAASRSINPVKETTPRTEARSAPPLSASEPVEVERTPVKNTSGSPSPAKVGAGGGGVLAVGCVIALIAIFNSAETYDVGALEQHGDAPLNVDNALSYELRADTPDISTIFTLPAGMAYRNISSAGLSVSLKQGCRNVEFDLALSVDGTPRYVAKFANRASGAARLTVSTMPTLDPVELDVPGTSRELRVTAHATLDPGCTLTLSLGSPKIVDSDTEWIVHFVS